MKLLYFIFGFTFISYIIPILDGISSWLLTWVETKKVKHSEIINQTNIKIRQAAASAEKDSPHKSIIGFRMPDLEEEEYEDDEI